MAKWGILFASEHICSHLSSFPHKGRLHDEFKEHVPARLLERKGNFSTREGGGGG